MKLIVVAPLWLSVPPQRYGGIERMVADLVDGLVEHGHEVTLYASGDSGTRAHHLVGIVSRPLCELDVAWHDVNYNLSASARALRQAEDEGHDAVLFEVERPYHLATVAVSRVPSIFTLHGVWTEATHPQSEVDMLQAHKDQNFVSISRAQQAGMPDLNYVANVYNGLDAGRHPFSPQPGNGAVWLGRLEEEKGAHLAIEVARKAGLTLRLAGPRRLDDPVGREYWETKIAPALGDGIEWVGELTDEEKHELLGSSAVMINPYVYQEAFGFAALEALASGTPVVTPRWGAGAEIVEDGVSGFTADSVEEMADAARQAMTLDREGCRARAEYFSVDRMVEGYERALGVVTGSAGAPRARESEEARLPRPRTRIRTACTPR